MKLIVFFIACMLFIMQWYITRKTKVNKFLPVIVVLVIAVPIGSAFGGHLVGFPVIMTILALALCELEDWLKQYWHKKGLTEVERSKLRDL